MEEKFVFPIGRRTWQILALIALLGLAAYIIWFAINSTPTSRDNVKVSRNEVINNQIDTVSTVKVVNEPTACEPKDYKTYEDSLKKDLPMGEWMKLGDSSEPFNDYYIDENGNYVIDEYGNYVFVQKRNFYPNPAAIPNILENVFSSRGLDTSQICERIEILKILHLLNGFTQIDYLNKEAFSSYAALISNSREINMNLISKSAELNERIDGNKLLVQNKESLIQFIKYIEYVNRKNITDEQIEICISLLDQHRKLSSPLFKKKNYFDLAEIVFECNIPTKELSVAISDFKGDLEYYDKNDLKKSLKRYLNLYEDKLSMAEMNKTSKVIKKASNRSFSLLAMGVCFASIISIATILLLYSIQQLLRDHTISKNS
jgi:hypothetical protein